MAAPLTAQRAGGADDGGDLRRRREFCHSAAPPSTLSRCINSDRERERQQNGRLGNGYGDGGGGDEDGLGRVGDHLALNVLCQ